ncbi:MAG: hypothetical protein M3R35_06615 [Candidatus Eremiobacteraeota bacterium]|nr:hypothetical protein [Candidatus Eremiobacteraeota bacterium]
MNYVELLRVFRALRVVGIILGLLLLAGITLRLVFLHAGSPETWVHTAQFAPGARISTVHAADGTTRTTIDDPDHTHVVIVDRGYLGKHITIVEPNERANSQREGQHISMGSMSMNEGRRAGMTRIDFETENSEDLSILFMATVPLALIFATLVSCTLARENDGHLEMAWTKPISRDAYALRSIGTDLAGIIVTVLVSVSVFIVINAMFQLPRFYLNERGAALAALAFLVPMAWYALLTAASASLKRGSGAVLGTAWPVAIILPGLVGLFAAHSESSLAVAIAGTLRAIDTLNPLVYLGNVTGYSGAHLLSRGVNAELVETIILLLVYIALAVLQWRRVEA